MSELLKGQREHLYSEAFPNKPSRFSEDSDVLKWTQNVHKSYKTDLVYFFCFGLLVVKCLYVSVFDGESVWL